MGKPTHLLRESPHLSMTGVTLRGDGYHGIDTTTECRSQLKVGGWPSVRRAMFIDANDEPDSPSVRRAMCSSID